MTLENSIRLLAGTFIVLSILAARFIHPHFIYFTLFVGINLIQSSFTGLCPAESLLKKLGVKPSTSGSCGK